MKVDANFTRAIRHGSAEYVALLHDDDRWQADFLAARVAALDANPACAFAFSGWVQMNKHGAAGEFSPLRFANGGLARMLVRRNPVVASTAVVRRSRILLRAITRAADASRRALRRRAAR